MRSALCASLAYTTLTAMAAPTRADAFLEKSGHGKIILLTTFDRADQYWTQDGRLVPIAPYKKFSLSASTDYGMDQKTTLIGRAEIGRLQDNAGAEIQMAGAIGVRRLLFDGGALRVAAQAVASVGDGIEGMHLRPVGASLDVRLAVARTFSLAGRTAFIEVSAGPRVVVGDARGLRLDATLKVRPADKWLLLLQGFNRFNELGPFRGRVKSHKVQASVVYDLTAHWSLIAGVFMTAAASAERRQQGMLAGAERRF